MEFSISTDVECSAMIAKRSEAASVSGLLCDIAGMDAGTTVLERFSVDVNRNNKGVPRGAQIRFGLL
jgi:hypothetical protein